VSLTVIVMAISGIAAGFVLEAIIVLLAAKPYGLSVPERASQGLDTSLPLSDRRDGTLPALLQGRSLPRSAAVVATTAVVFALVGRQYHRPLDLAIVAAYATVLIVCSATDVLAFRVPNVVTYPATIGALALGMAMPDANRLDVIAGGVVFGGLLFVPAVLMAGAVGMGSVKLAFFVGFALGLTFVVPAILMTLIATGIVAALLLTTRIRRRGDPIPYAPFIAVGMLVVLLMQGTAFRTL